MRNGSNKANNLILSSEKVTLIDPDDAGKSPRILDLALAVLIFHNELDSVLGQLFNAKEWQDFQMVISLNSNSPKQRQTSSQGL